MTLKTELAFLTSFLLLVAIGGFSTVLLLTERQSLITAQERRQEASVQGLAEVCRDALVNERDLPLTNYLRRLSASGEVLEAACVNTEKTVVGHTDPTLMGLPLPAPEKDPTVRTADVRVGQSLLGKVRILYDTRLLDNNISLSLEEARRRICRVSLGVAALGFLLAFLTTAWAVRPVRLLVEGVRAIASGEWTRRIRLTRRDEIGWLAEEFNEMAGRLGELDRMKADFVNGITHDLKSPLTAIKIATDNLRIYLDKPEHPDSAREGTVFIHRNTDRLMDLITSILDVAKIESGLKLVKSPVDLETLADQVVRTFRPMAEAKGLSLHMTVEAPINPFPADKGKLERVLSNLVSNAVKFTEQGEVTVTVSRDDANAVATVRDTGPGIPDDFRKRLFTKFSRAGSSEHKVEGSGLGLAIAKGFVEAHGGTLEARNDGGAVFTMRIPLP